MINKHCPKHSARHYKRMAATTAFIWDESLALRHLAIDVLLESIGAKAMTS